MKKVLVVGSKNSGKKNNPEVLAKSMMSDDITVKIIYWEDIMFSIATGSVHMIVNGEDILIERPDVCIALGWYKNGKKSFYRDIAYAFALILKYNSIPFWNSEMGMQRSTTKLSIMVQLALDGIPVPKSVFSISTNLSVTFFEFPYVAKAISASRGENNYLVTNSQSCETVIHSDSPMLIQEFLENSHDLRVICFAGNPTLILKRSRKNPEETHKNNTSQGAIATWLPRSSVGSDLLTTCENICKITGRELAGIDFIPDDSSPIGYSCLEVNPIPQLTSGFDIDIKLDALKHAIQDN